jgi:hypothetical protein
MTKPTSEFMKQDIQLKTCFSCRQYQIVNRSAILAKRNPEHVKATDKKHRLKKIQYYTEKNKEYREKYPDYQKNYYEAHKIHSM